MLALVLTPTLPPVPYAQLTSQCAGMRRRVAPKLEAGGYPGVLMSTSGEGRQAIWPERVPVAPVILAKRALAG